MPSKNSATTDPSELPFSVVVVGASGDLARRKVLPALFHIFSHGLLPEQFHLVGLARTNLDDEGFRERIREDLVSHAPPEDATPENVREFLSRCFYVSGPYNEADSFLRAYQALRGQEGDGLVNRLYYMAIPPFLFLDVAHSIADAGLVRCGEEKTGWSRAVIEKPFGRDRASSDELVSQMAYVFSEGQTYRIDHYLGKEVIQNLMVLRFANRIFEPIWNREHVENVRIAFSETLGVEGRGGYFDEYGIIRDVIQNHLLQILALTAMEPPSRLTAKHVRDEKVRVLRAIPPAAVENAIVGQYGPSQDGASPGYTDDETVPDGSLTPTYAAVRLAIENERWEGVPFLLTAGKGLADHATEIQVRFRPLPNNIFCDTQECLEPNCLTIRIQPDEAIRFRITNKAPGLGMELATRELDMRYKAAFEQPLPDAYEALILDSIRGDKSLFIRRDELEAAWDIFTPLLHAIEESATPPEPYPYGSNGPERAENLLPC